MPDDDSIPPPPREPRKPSRWQRFGIWLGLVEEPGEVDDYPYRYASDGTVVNPKPRDIEILREQADAPLPEHAAMVLARHNAMLKELREDDTMWGYTDPMTFLDIAEDDPTSHAHFLRTAFDDRRRAEAEAKRWEALLQDRVIQMALKVIDTRDRITKSPRFVALQAKMGRGKA